MDNLNQYRELEKLLRMESRYCTEDGVLLKNAIVEAALELRPELIKLLLTHDALKRNFFTEIDGVLVFDKVKFQKFVMNKRFLPDSYTSFKNKIGLTDDNGNFVSESRKIVLSWPYKDCILEGGQTKEDVKRNEVFWNEILEPDEINRLTEPKVITNFVKYDYYGKSIPSSVSIDNNYIIKGNNLLTLYSLRKNLSGKVKLIYIDPPYNTGNDTFGYNDRFNRSSWLCFMRNRLMIARELLAENGAIYMQLDYHQVHYAKILMDEIFGEENFQREIIWRIGWLSGYKTVDNNWIRNHDTILFYSKNNSIMEFNKEYIPRCEFKSIAQGNADRYPIEDVWNGNEYDDLNSIAIVSFAGETVSKMLNSEDEVKGQKSEKLIERILKAHTSIGDLVLDFFGGSGTTAAVAHKMKRKYIVCEQLDKHLDIMIRRVNRVIEGEQSGISKRHNWQGGGSFVYCELATANKRFVDEIMSAKSDFELTKIWSDMQQTGFLSWKIEPRQIEEHATEFAELSIEDKKRFLIECLDKNMLYVPLSEINNAEFGISNEVKKLNSDFYSGL